MSAFHIVARKFEAALRSWGFVREPVGSVGEQKFMSAPVDERPNAVNRRMQQEAEAREASIQAGLLGLFLRGTLFRQRVGASLMLVFTAFCWRHADGWLVVWLGTGLSILLWRNRREAAYARLSEGMRAKSRTHFIASMRPIFAAQGAIWGFSLFFSFSGLPLYDQLGCWLVLACVASAPLTTVALVPSLSKAYTNSLFIGLVSVLLMMTASKDAGAAAPDVLMLGLPFFYWWLLNRFGKGIYRNQREQFGLQHDVALREREAREAVRIKDRFLAAGAHDIRQPVLALSLYAEHLLEFPDMHLELAPKIAAASLAVRGMFESIFDLANLDSGQVRLKAEPVDIAHLIQELHVQFEPLAAARGIQLRWRSVQACLDTDAVRLQRLLGNLVGNAIKYSESHRKILVAARWRLGRVRIEVIDQGFGIPEKDLCNVFQEFFRVDRPDAAAIDGVGLGLSIVSRLATLLRAKVRVQSTVGHGTRFTVDLQSLAHPEAAAAEQAEDLDPTVLAMAQRTARASPARARRGRKVNARIGPSTAFRAERSR